MCEHLHTAKLTSSRSRLSEPIANFEKQCSRETKSDSECQQCGNELEDQIAHGRARELATYLSVSTWRVLAGSAQLCRNITIFLAISMLPVASLHQSAVPETSRSASITFHRPIGYAREEATFVLRGSWVRGRGLDNPTITTNPQIKPSGAILDISHWVQVTISHVSQDVDLFYTVSGEELCCNPPTGTRYSEPITLCESTSPVDIRAVACKPEPHPAASEVVSLQSVFNIQPRVLSPPAPPSFDTIPADACKAGAAEGSLTCNSGGLFRVLLAADESSCSNPDWGTQAECVREGHAWGPTADCAKLQGSHLPCISIRYTVDGSDPRSDSSAVATYDSGSGIPVGGGLHEIKAVVVRQLPAYDAQECACCCRGSCSVAGEVGARLLEVRNALPTAVRDPHIGSPDITVTVQTYFETFQAAYFSQPFKWRSALASALGLFHNEIADFRRVKGECACAQEQGCIRESKAGGGTGPDICFHPGPAGAQYTLVSFYVTAAGSCIGGKTDDICVSNSSCGDSGMCDLDAKSWEPAYARLQIEHKETMQSLAAMNVIDVKLQADIDTAKVLSSGSNAAEIAATVVVVGGVLLLAVAKRTWIMDQLHALLPSLQSKGRQLHSKVRQVREEGRLSRHAQFAKMAELSEPDTDSASADLSLADENTLLDSGAGPLKPLWAAKSAYDKPRVPAVNPIAAFFSTTATTPQTMALALASHSSDDLLHSHVAEEGGGAAGEEEWSAFTAEAEEPVRLRCEVVGTTAQLQVALEYEPAAIAARRPTLVSRLLFRNASPAPVAEFTCKAAVPKYMQVQITPPSASTLPALSSAPVSQTLRLGGVDPLKPIKVRLKLEYARDGGGESPRARPTCSSSAHMGRVPQACLQRPSTSTLATCPSLSGLPHRPTRACALVQGCVVAYERLLYYSIHERAVTRSNRLCEEGPIRSGRSSSSDSRHDLALRPRACSTRPCLRVRRHLSAGPRPASPCLPPNPRLLPSRAPPVLGHSVPRCRFMASSRFSNAAVSCATSAASSRCALAPIPSRSRLSSRAAHSAYPTPRPR